MIICLRLVPVSRALVWNTYDVHARCGAAALPAGISAMTSRNVTVTPSITWQSTAVTVRQTGDCLPFKRSTPCAPVDAPRDTCLVPQAACSTRPRRPDGRQCEHPPGSRGHFAICHQRARMPVADHGFDFTCMSTAPPGRPQHALRVKAPAVAKECTEDSHQAGSKQSSRPTQPAAGDTPMDAGEAGTHPPAQQSPPTAALHLHPPHVLRRPPDLIRWRCTSKCGSHTAVALLTTAIPCVTNEVKERKRGYHQRPPPIHQSQPWPFAVRAPLAGRPGERGHAVCR